ncbi:MAG: DnaT-like ssDNA-binding protein [Pseudomonadota bacterium]
MSYGSQAAFAAYCAARAYDLTAFDASAQTAALVRASGFVDGLGYRDNGTGIRTPLWPGTPAVAGQANEWPREGASDIYGNAIASDAVPQRVEHAAYEVAFFDLGGGDINRSVAQDQVVIRERFDTVEFQYAGANGETIDTRPMLPAVMDLLAPVISGGDRAGLYGITMVVA